MLKLAEMGQMFLISVSHMTTYSLEEPPDIKAFGQIINYKKIKSVF